MFGVKMMGNLHTYAKQIRMETQWRQKQSSGNYSARLNLFTGAAVGENQTGRLMDALSVKEPSEEEKAADRKKLDEINSKLKLGDELTKEELEFLKEKSPALYEEYMTAEEARKSEEQAYKEALKQCRTKEEVARLKSTTMGRRLARVKSIENNPHIPSEKKAFHIGMERRKAEDAQRNTLEFVRRGEYDKLPTEAEVREVEKAEAEERLAQKGLEPGGIHIGKKPEDVKAAETAEKTAQADHRENLEAPERKKPEIGMETESERKVRRAKAKVAYAWMQSDSGGELDSGWSRKV